MVARTASHCSRVPMTLTSWGMRPYGMPIRARTWTRSSNCQNSPSAGSFVIVTLRALLSQGGKVLPHGGVIKTSFPVAVV